MTTSYLDALRAIGLPARETGIWASVGTPDRAYGWKLHLSSVQGEASRLIECIGPALRDHGVPFKIAATDEILGELNEGTFGATQVGKFATLYPRSDDECVDLARILLALTQGYCGPRIITDLALGNVLYVRYGQFNRRLVGDRPGDASFVPPEGRANPFANWPLSSPVASDSGRLIGPGFMVTGVLAAKAKGPVSLAMDLRSAEHLGIAVLKEGRRHGMSDGKGRHMWDRLRHQHALGETLAGLVRVPAPRVLFEQGDSLFLAIDYIDGRDFSDRGASAFCALDPTGRRALLRDFVEVTHTLEALHEAGIVHRDLCPGNVRIGIDGKVWLIDLEMADHVGAQERLFVQATTGFTSPEQQSGGAAAFTDDIYSLGCLLANALTGFDPARMSLADDGGLAERLAALSGAPEALVDICALMLSAEPRLRPSLDEIRAVLNADRPEPRVRPSAQTGGWRLVGEAAAWLIRGGLRDGATGLPLSPELQSAEPKASPVGYKLYRSAGRGVAGVLYSVARLARLGVRHHDDIDFADRAADWLLSRHPTDDDQMPGLHFGEAGVALALLEAIHSGLIDSGRWLRPYLAQTFSGTPDLPDLTHGAAGQGLAALQAAHLAEMPELVDFAHDCAAYLRGIQQPDGGWRCPDGIAAVEGPAYTGFAQGTAGIAYFLSVHARLCGSDASRVAATRAGAWLVDQARLSNDRLSHRWPREVDGDDAGHMWCHGGPGIAITFLSLHALTGEPLWANFARSALRVHPPYLRWPNLSQCHGLAGIGEVYLEAWRILGEPLWLERARQIGGTLTALRRSDEGMASWVFENSVHPTADLMIGCGGVAHFLARLQHDNVRCLGMPLSIDPDVCERSLARAGEGAMSILLGATECQ